MSTQFTVNISVIVINKDRKILLAHRSPNEDVYPNLWGIPGGKIENTDASIEDGLQREVEEEVGIRIKNFQLISNNIRTKDNGQNVLYMVYKAEYSGGEPQALEDTDEVRWFNFPDIDSSKLTPFTYEVIKKALN